jgi:hypothetical protein
MNELQNIISMLISADEETFVLGLTLLNQIDPELIQEGKVVNVSTDGTYCPLQDMSLYYDFKYNLKIINHPKWDLIKDFPINRKFRKFLNSTQPF